MSLAERVDVPEITSETVELKGYIVIALSPSHSAWQVVEYDPEGKITQDELVEQQTGTPACSLNYLCVKASSPDEARRCAETKGLSYNSPDVCIQAGYNNIRFERGNIPPSNPLIGRMPPMPRR